MEQSLRGKDQRKNLLNSQLRKVYTVFLLHMRQKKLYWFLFFFSQVFQQDFFVKFLEQAPEGLEKTIMTMRKGEQATVTVMAEYLSDKNKFLTTPANHEVLYYEVQLVDFIKVSFS